MNKYLLIAFGGALGSLLRYFVQGWAHRLLGVSFPIGTLLVNVTGCLLIGILAAMYAGPQLIREEYRIGLTVGFLGGFTTFSTFGLETLKLAESDKRQGKPLNNAIVLNACARTHADN